MGEKALNVVKQAIDLALANGVYKNTQDVVLIHNSLIELQKVIKDSNDLNNLIKDSSSAMKKDVENEKNCEVKTPVSKTKK